MNVKGIFVTLITIVGCVIIGAFVLNTLLPNVTTTLINSAESMIQNATSLEFDFNGDGVGANQDTFMGENTDDTVTGVVGGNVEGFN